MYGIFTYIYHKNQPNVGKYTIHGSYGYWKITIFNRKYIDSFMVDFPASHVNFQGCIAVEPVSQRCHWTSQMCGKSWRFLKKTTRQNPSEPEWTNKSYWWKLPHKAATHNSCKWTKEPQDSLIMFQSHGPSLTFPSPRIYIYIHWKTQFQSIPQILHKCFWALTSWHSSTTSNFGQVAVVQRSSLAVI